MPTTGTHHYIELAIELNPSLFELAIAMLSREGIDSFMEEETRLLAYLPESEWNEKKELSIRQTLEQTFGTIPPCTASFMADRNWNAEWEAHLQPIEISDRIIIIQKNKEITPKPGQIVIEINPKMSFGTGYHATTRLMLRQMETLDLVNKKIMDIGTGTGVLAIAARKLGNNLPILAFDNNAWATDNAIENVEENHADNIAVELLDAEEDLVIHLGEGYDLILANINKNVIDRILPIIRKHAPQAPVLLSGILIYDEPWLKKLLKKLNYQIEKTIYEDEWLSSLVRPTP
ncbi:50S ribosomal protein L11 methyltransferase [Chlorobium phaeobacteroides]|uniref:Ribosomal protein L11 methyltransferase n=1 Tax=Chlorobium phaeobacteroides (strain DSM 266 / SMG 266 / 2430) TaxID=290317 RepID=A1BJJ6_CHLPD|nr:50S ribosomal protein L11 methyltransferase [Chlorobium phaeobacteroides]ABL66573.1 [LSU ribosomal protein L11P]-lysine N-methyltransferase [Chlorobium phaeobacteroides DSM 266]